MGLLFHPFMSRSSVGCSPVDTLHMAVVSCWLCSAHHKLSLLLLALLQCGILHGRHCSMNFSSMNPSHSPSQQGCPSMGCSPSEPGCSSGVPVGSQVLQDPAQSGFHGLTASCRGRAATTSTARTWPRSAAELSSHCCNPHSKMGFPPLPAAELTWWQSNDHCQSKALHLKGIIHTVFAPYQWLFLSSKNQSILPKMLSWNVHKLYMWNTRESARRMAQHSQGCAQNIPWEKVPPCLSKNQITMSHLS